VAPFSGARVEGSGWVCCRKRRDSTCRGMGFQPGCSAGSRTARARRGHGRPRQSLRWA